MEELSAAYIHKESRVSEEVCSEERALNVSDVEVPLVNPAAELQADLSGAVSVDLAAVGSGEGSAELMHLS